MTRQRLAAKATGIMLKDHNQIPLLEWTMLYRRYIRPGALFDLNRHLYLLDIYRCDAPKVVVPKAGQVGISEYAVSYALHLTDVRGGNVLYLMPTAADVSDFSRMRFGTALEASPYLNELIVQKTSKEESEARFRGADRVDLKRVRDNWLIFRGATVSGDGRARQLKSVPADAIVFDELDEMNPDAIAIAQKRLGHSEIKEERYISTPTFHGFGIDAEWRQSDQREWFVPCPHCGKWQMITLGNVVLEYDDLERPIVWHGQDEERAFAVCRKCSKELDRLAHGRWVARHPERDVVGFHPTKLFSPFTELIEIVKNFQTVDGSKRREAVNQDLGLPYEAEGDRITADQLRRCMREYALADGSERVRCVAGIDVGRVYNIIIRALPNEQGERKLLYAGEIGEEMEVIRQLRRFNPLVVVIDGLPEARSSRNIQNAFARGVVWLAYYSSAEEGVKTADEVQWTREYTVNCDRTRTLDGMFGRIVQEENTLPANAEGIRNYFSQMTTMVRVMKERKNKTPVIVYIESSADHYAHAENYAYVASLRKLGWSR